MTASDVRNQKSGMLLWSTSQASTPFGGGTLCVGSPLKRTPPQNSGGSPIGTDRSGTYAYTFTHAYLIAQGLSAGTTVHAQYWSRDPGFAAPNNVGLTKGLKFTVCP